MKLSALLVFFLAFGAGLIGGVVCLGFALIALYNGEWQEATAFGVVSLCLRLLTKIEKRGK